MIKLEQQKNGILKMINNKNMKNTFLIFSLISLLYSPVFAVPDTITGGEITFTVWDDSYNTALHQKLVAEYDKKYLKCNKTGDYCNYDLRNYDNEVTIPYELNKQQDYKIIKQKTIKLN